MSEDTTFFKKVEELREYMTQNDIRMISSKDVEQILKVSRTTALNIMRAMALQPGWSYTKGVLIREKVNYNE